MSNIKLPFVKMEGLSNSYIFVQADRVRKYNLPKIARHISSRDYGIGADGLITIAPDKSPFLIRIFNRDGSEAQMCGNGIRQAALYLKKYHFKNRTKFDIATGAGVFSTEILFSQNNQSRVLASIGAPDFTRDAVGLRGVRKLAFGIKLNYRGQEFIADCVSVGNPHAVIKVDNFDFPWVEIGRAFSNHKMFKDGVNVHFLKIDKPSRYAMRIFERGSGTTLGCGSGAAACLVVGVMRGWLNTKATAEMPGGNLQLHWDFDSGQIVQTGPANIICEGEYYI
ncbi:MAG: diaminopimelate epimerase [candidate division Zixibacteria bacterium]|jgi:diaminopimelate epimerase|nr:diaminopimelate epimerase [candidate division Zixibacteria bacterium]